MPLRDHFRPPVSQLLSWATLHAGWAASLVENLNGRWLPAGFVAGERSFSANHPEIDIATWETPLVAAPVGGNGAATATAAAVYTVPEPDHTAELREDLAPTTDILIHDENRMLVAVIELVSPSNKDRPRERTAFAAKVASYVMGGVSVAILDVVTPRRANLHDAVCEALELPDDLRMPGRPPTYAVTYRPKTADRTMAVDVWARELAVSQPLPTMPLRLTGDTFVPLELEETYTDACRKRRLL
jgi:Protein of unknown function (DUF4058)